MNTTLYEFVSASSVKEVSVTFSVLFKRTEPFHPVRTYLLFSTGSFPVAELKSVISPVIYGASKFSGPDKSGSVRNFNKSAYVNEDPLYA